MSNALQAPVWLITGGTSGFGLAIAKAAARRAHMSDLLFGRRGRRAPQRLFERQLTVERLDVRDAAQGEAGGQSASASTVASMVLVKQRRLRTAGGAL